MEGNALLKTRRSVRRYRQEPIPVDVLREIADAARYAPSGGNSQPWELVAVNDPEKVDQVYETLAWLPSVGAPPEGKRPVAYFVVISEKESSVADCASLVSHLLLAAHERGIGSCWFGSIRRAELADDLNIPEDYRVAFVVSLGYPDEKFETYETTGQTKVAPENGTVRVPKRPLNSIFHKNGFGS